MKNAAKKWYLYVIALAIVVIIAIIAVVPYLVGSWAFTLIKDIFLFSGIVVFLVGFIIQDIYRARNRRETKNWAGKLPKEVTDKAWNIFYPFFLSGILSVVVGGVFTIIERFVA